MKNRVAAKALRKNTEKKLKKKAMRRWKKWKAAGEEKEKEEGEEGDWQVGSFEQLQQRFAEWDQFNWKVRTPPAAEAETPQKEELKERQDKLRLLKGQPVTLVSAATQSILSSTTSDLAASSPRLPPVAQSRTPPAVPDVTPRRVYSLQLLRTAHGA